MAVTQYHAIKSTVEKAIHYIVNPDKTDGQILVSSYMCSDDEQAADDFEIVRQLGTRNGTVLAQHLIQSFLPNETTPEQAHEIGIKLAERFLKGHYQYVLATHIDKQHIHNHLIFNNVSFDNHRTFNMNENRGKHAWKVLQQISDQICREQQLYVIPNPEQRKGKCWYEWQHDQKGSSWKKQLKHGIDEAIMSSSNLSEFWEECRKRNIEFQYRPDRRISLKFRMTDAGQDRKENCKLRCFRPRRNQLRAENKDHRYLAGTLCRSTWTGTLGDATQYARSIPYDKLSFGTRTDFSGRSQ